MARGSIGKNKTLVRQLFDAVKSGELETVITLLNNGIDVDVKDFRGHTPLLEAAIYRHKDIVEYLINTGADGNISTRNGFTVLHYAAGNGWLEITQVLLNNGIDIDAKDSNGHTPLLEAAKYGHKDIVELLIKAGADIHCFSCPNYTMLHYASKNGWLKVVQCILKNGTSIETKTEKGETALHIAFEHDEIETAGYLIYAGANIHATTNERHSILYYSAKGSYTKPVRLLVNRGAYFTPLEARLSKPILIKKHLLQDIEFCSQAIINEFNHKHLPELYKQPMACEILPRMEYMYIPNSSSQVRNEVVESVKREIKRYRYCDLLQARPRALKMLAVKSFLDNCGIKNQPTNLPWLCRCTSTYLGT